MILPDERAVCACDVRGGAPGTRETDALAPENLVEAVDAVVLSGGSVYGLAAADGVAAWLGARGRGYGAGGRSGRPAVAGGPGRDPVRHGQWRRQGLGRGSRPTARWAARLRAASEDLRLGTAGAGYGAMAGRAQGRDRLGLDRQRRRHRRGRHRGGEQLGLGRRAGRPDLLGRALRDRRGSSAAWAPAGLTAAPDDWGLAKGPASARNTTIACVATDVALTPAQAKRVAIMAQDGLARAIRPVHAPFDGDVVFALSTARRACRSRRT